MKSTSFRQRLILLPSLSCSADRNSTTRFLRSLYVEREKDSWLLTSKHNAYEFFSSLWRYLNCEDQNDPAAEEQSIYVECIHTNVDDNFFHLLFWKHQPGYSLCLVMLLLNWLPTSFQLGHESLCLHCFQKWCALVAVWWTACRLDLDGCISGKKACPH